jgi:hypothetical protein
MDIRKLQRAIVDGLEDVKAQNIVVFNTEHLSRTSWSSTPSTCRRCSSG